MAPHFCPGSCARLWQHTNIMPSLVNLTRHFNVLSFYYEDFPVARKSSHVKRHSCLQILQSHFVHTEHTNCREQLRMLMWAVLVRCDLRNAIHLRLRNTWGPVSTWCFLYSLAAQWLAGRWDEVLPSVRKNAGCHMDFMFYGKLHDRRAPSFCFFLLSICYSYYLLDIVF